MEETDFEVYLQTAVEGAQFNGTSKERNPQKKRLRGTEQRPASRAQIPAIVRPPERQKPRLSGVVFKTVGKLAPPTKSQRKEIKY